MDSLTNLDSERMAAAATRSGATGSRLEVLAGLVAGEAYSIYATFIAHVLSPISVYIVDRSTGRVLMRGQLGDLAEVFHWDGLFATLVLSFAVFIVTCWAVRSTARWIRQRNVDSIAGLHRSPAFVSHPSTTAQLFH